jgi:adenylate cyclase
MNPAIPGSPPPFLTESVARAKKRREIIRLFAVSIGTCLFVGLSSGEGVASIPRLIFMDGIPFGLMLLFLRRLQTVRMPSVGLAILFRSVAYTLVIAVSIVFSFSLVVPGQDFLQMARKSRGLLLSVLLLAYVQVLLVTGIRGVARKLGPGAFWNWIRGYYYTPKEEERIFMFLDIRRSTALAESLGDLRFSRLVRDFFDDLTGPIVETRAEVSHFIGDEAVLTWRPRIGLAEARCLQVFFRMQAMIQRRRAHYLEEYGGVPEFKAGAHIGRVVATEVGKIKSEIVFHGDVLNTTARVQGACSEVGSDFLITEALASRLPPVSWLELQPIGGVALKGKSEKVQLLSVSVRSN